MKRIMRDELQQMEEYGTKDYVDEHTGIGALHEHVQRPKVIAALLDHGCSINLRTREGKFTPLMLAVVSHVLSCLETTRILLERGALVDTVSTEGMCALDYAIERGEHGTTIRLLMRYGAKRHKPPFSLRRALTIDRTNEHLVYIPLKVLLVLCSPLVCPRLCPGRRWPLSSDMIRLLHDFLLKY